MMLLLLVVACGEPTKDAPTWHRDVKPIVDTYCVRCHNDQALGTAFTEVENVVAHATEIGARVEAGEMPPPSPDPSCRDYQDADRFILPEDARQTLLDWVAADAPLGEETDAPPPEEPAWAPEADVELETEPFAPDFTTARDIHMCFPVDAGNAESLWLKGWEVQPDNPHVVHHMVIFQTTALDPERFDPDGFPCGDLYASQDGDDLPSLSLFGAWAFGANPVVFPEGMAYELAPGSTFVFELHFNGPPELTGESAAPRLILDTTEPPETPIVVNALVADGFTIPANESRYDFLREELWSLGDYQVLMVMPHMHELGTAFAMESGPPGEESCMVAADPWNFHNQVVLRYEEPVWVRDGDRVAFTCTWDNSAENPYQPNDPPVDVLAGGASANEMCTGMTYGYMGAPK